jgi:hypothetical protein
MNDQTSRPAFDRATIATAVIAIATVANVWVATCQWSVADRALKASERPWLTPEATLKVDDPALGGDVARFLWKNTGRTPALHVEVHAAQCEPGTKSVPPEAERGLDMSVIETQSILGPGTAFAIGLRPEDLRPPQRAVWEKDHLPPAIALRVEYSDEFGDPHTTRICLYPVGRGKGWTPCGGWAFADAN